MAKKDLTPEDLALKRAQQRERYLRWKEKDPERARRQGRENAAKRRAANPDRSKDTQDAFRERHRDEIRAKKRAFRQTEEGKAAHRAEEKRRRERDPERFRRIARDYAHTPKGRTLNNLAVKRWRVRNPGKDITYTQRWRAANPGKEAARTKLRRKTHPEVFRQRDKRNYIKLLERMAVDPDFAAKVKARQGGYKLANKAKRRVQEADDGFTHADVIAILKMQRGQCAICGVKLNRTFHRDHIKPLARGGRNVRSNIQISCKSCNLKKGAKDPVDFMQSLGFLL